MSGADTAWLMTATTLVFFMTMPGLALFYGGLVRAKNVLSIFLQIYVIACIVSLLWYVIGYSIAFGSDAPYWGGTSKILMRGVGLDSQEGSIPEVTFFAFQMMFAVITPALIIGACAERIRFGFLMLFSALWSVLVYAPVAHWVWGGGFLSDGGIFGASGVRDFAGGIVVHETAGVAGLMIAVVLGARKDATDLPHNQPMAMIGAAMLWVGWFGFNGGSSLASDASAGMALAVTHLAAASASVTWIAWEYIKTGRFTVIGLVTGTIAGLATVTPASGYVSLEYALVIGVVAGVLCQETLLFLRDRLRIDDTLAVFAVHGAGGIYGSIMLAALGVATWQAQLGGIAIVAAYCAAVTFVLIFFCKGILGMRVSDEAEAEGLDLASHREEAYGPE